MLELEGVSKTFFVRRTPIHALQNVSLRIANQRLTSILGPSGSGKSTLLRVIAGFERPDNGQLTLENRPLVDSGVFVRPEKRGIGIVSQDGALFPHVNVAENIGFGLSKGWSTRLSPGRRRAATERVDELLQIVGLEGFQSRRVDQLSGGQQQRVALARALAPNPNIVLLDEPFSALDAALRAELRIEVRDLLRQLGITAVMVTHDQEEALSLADDVVVMRDGRIVQSGKPRQVYENPVDTDTARFVGDAVVLEGTVVSGTTCQMRVQCALGQVTGVCSAGRDGCGSGLHSPYAHLSGASDSLGLPSSDDRPCQVIIRPESLRMNESGMPAVVVSSEYFGHDALTSVRLGAGGDGPLVRVRTNGPERLPSRGSTVGLHVDDPVVVVPSAA